MTARSGAHAPEVVLDLSRLLSRVHHPTPTGVDRVEMAYARGLRDAIPDRLRFGAVHPARVYGRLAPDKAWRFLADSERSWRDGGGTVDRAAFIARRGVALLGLRPERVPRGSGPRIYVQSSPHHLDREPLVRRILARERARAIFLIHDLIPIEYPEYATTGGRDTHLKRMGTVARLADAVIANSDATRRSFLPYLAEAGRSIPVEVAHLGLEDTTIVPTIPARLDTSTRPYFVCIGTIEPRKNHLLLLHLWRAMSEARSAAAVPRLIVIGRRGWENEQIIDMLDRCPALRGCVEELNGLHDEEMRALLAGAHGLLLPSFAEGYGMPVPEALSAGVPVICSDLPALREAGQDIPCYLDPLDGPAWRHAIDDFACGGPLVTEQRARMVTWRGPRWSEHINVLLATIANVAARSA